MYIIYVYLGHLSDVPYSKLFSVSWYFVYKQTAPFFLLNYSRLLLCYLFRWANQGLDFLTVACDPKTLTTLTESEFQVIIFFSVFIVYFLTGEGCVWGGSSIVQGLPSMFVTCLCPSSVIYNR